MSLSSLSGPTGSRRAPQQLAPNYHRRSDLQPRPSQLEVQVQDGSDSSQTRAAGPERRTGGAVNTEPSRARGNGSSVPPRKRQKISLACEECRARKVRCDGLRPQCSACMKKYSHRQPCDYPSEPSKSASTDRRLMQSLQDRLAQLEGQLQSDTASKEVSHRRPSISETEQEDHRCRTRESTSASRAHQFSSTRRPRAPSVDSSDKPISQHAATTPPQQLPQSAATIGPNDDTGSINAMGVAGLSPEEFNSTSGEFYGKSSATAFFSDIQDRLRPSRCYSPKPRMESGRTSGHQPGLEHLRPTFHDQALLELDDYHLPPRHLADQLLDLYWRRVQCLYPYLHWPTLIAAYRRLWMSNEELKRSPPVTGVGLGGIDCSAPVFYCALNAIFALGTQFLERSPQEQKERARPFARRAQHLLRLDYLDRGDLALVQALLIMAHYLQSTNLPSRCWNVAGVAYRMAQGLGLHIEVDSRRTNSLQKEMQRRVWHGCVCLDIVLGMTLGRPCLNSRKSSVSLPEMLDEELSTPRSTDSQDYATAAFATTFFVETIKLYKILDTILSQVYDPWKEFEAGKVDGTEDVAKEYARQISCIISLDSELRQFEARLPETLHWSYEAPVVSEDDVLRRQRNVLRTRYLHTRVLLYRPVFVQLCQRHASHALLSASERSQILPQGEHQLFDLIAERCSLSCIDHAQNLIDHISSASRTEDTGAPWFNSYYLYHSAMVLTLAEFCPSVKQQLDQTRLRRSWHQCQQYLDRMIEHDPESYRYLRTLQSISKYVNAESTGDERGGISQDASVREERQGMIVDHITNPCLDPTMASWLDDSNLFDLYVPMDGNFGLDLFRDQTWSLAGYNPGVMTEEWDNDRVTAAMGFDRPER